MKTTSFILLFCFFSVTINAQINKSFGSLEKKAVVKRLFDNAGLSSNGEILWTPNYSEAINNLVSDDNYCHTIMDTIMYYRANESDNAVVIFTTHKYENGEKESCHVCAPIIGIATFERRVDSNWELKQFQKTLMVSGSYGERDKLFLTRIGKDTYSLTISGGYGNQGSIECYVTYYSLQEGDNFNKIFNFQNYSTNEGASENGYSSTTSIRFLQTQEMYYTIELVTKWSNKKQINKLLYNYSFNTGKYEFTRKVQDNVK